MTMMFSLLERQSEKAGESKRDEPEIAKWKKAKRERGQNERERVVSRYLTYVHVFSVAALAAAESWVNLGDRSKW